MRAAAVGDGRWRRQEAEPGGPLGDVVASRGTGARQQRPVRCDPVRGTTASRSGERGARPVRARARWRGTRPARAVEVKAGLGRRGCAARARVGDGHRGAQEPRRGGRRTESTQDEGEGRSVPHRGSVGHGQRGSRRRRRRTMRGRGSGEEAVRQGLRVAAKSRSGEGFRGTAGSRATVSGSRPTTVLGATMGFDPGGGEGRRGGRRGGVWWRRGQATPARRVAAMAGGSGWFGPDPIWIGRGSEWGGRLGGGRGRWCGSPARWPRAVATGSAAGRTTAAGLGASTQMGSGGREGEWVTRRSGVLGVG